MIEIFSVYTLLWIGWLLYFGIVEAVALMNPGSRGTLSAHVWAIFGVGRDDEARWHLSWRRIIVIVPMLILTSHFAFGIP